MTTRNYRWLAYPIFAGGLVCLALTATMNFLQGESLGVTDAGKWVNSISSVVVDVVGLLFMGLAAGACLAAKRWLPAIVFSLVVIFSAVWSVNSMIGFQAGERLAAADVYNKGLARDARADDLIASNSSWFTRMTAKVGRSARRDYIAAASDSAKELRGTKAEARVDPAAGTKVIAKTTGSDVESVAIGQISYLALLLIFLKAVSFPSAAWFWAPLAVKQEDGSDDANHKNSGGSGGSSNGEPGKLKVVRGEPKPEPAKIRAEPSKQRSVFYVPSTGAPERNLSAFDRAYEVATQHPYLSTRAIAARAGVSQSTGHRVKQRALTKVDRMIRKMGNGRGYQTPAYN